MKPRKPSEYINSITQNKSRVYSNIEETTPNIIELIQDSELDVKNCRVPFDQSIFRPEPPNLYLEGFLPFKSYEMIISFRNMDKVPLV
jgi:hypothetical protein